jgi:hypothetical protein
MKLPTMYKLYRKLFPGWYYNREFKRLDSLVRRLAVPFEPGFLSLEFWGPPLTQEALGDLYSFIFFGTSHNCEDDNIVYAAEYLQDMAEECSFDKMADFTRYYKKQKRRLYKRIQSLIKQHDNS